MTEDERVLITPQRVLNARARRARWKAAHPEQVRTSRRKHDAENRAHINAKQQERRERNRESVNAQARAYRNRDVEAARQRARDWRAANPDYAPEQSVKLAAHRQVIRQFLADLKLFVGCVDCGYREHRAALDFDHVIGPKVGNIGTLFNAAVITGELAKCVVRCANCHAIRTFKNKNLGRPLSRQLVSMAQFRLSTGCTDCGYAGHHAALKRRRSTGEVRCGVCERVSLFGATNG